MPQKKRINPRRVAPERVKESPFDTGATSKEKTKTNPLVPSTPVVARRRMTTPVVAPRSGFYPPNLRGETLEVKKNDVIPEFSFRDSGMKISGISAARRA